jgi:hypothetical protein
VIAEALKLQPPQRVDVVAHRSHHHGEARATPGRSTAQGLRSTPNAAAPQPDLARLRRPRDCFGYAVVALVMLVLIITISFGIAFARIALFCLWPFGRDIVDIDQARRASSRRSSRMTDHERGM